MAGLYINLGPVEQRGEKGGKGRERMIFIEVFIDNIIILLITSGFLLQQQLYRQAYQICMSSADASMLSYKTVTQNSPSTNTYTNPLQSSSQSIYILPTQHQYNLSVYFPHHSYPKLHQKQSQYISITHLQVNVHVRHHGLGHHLLSLFDKEN